MDAGTALLPMMTADQARQCADQIRRGMSNVGQLLLDFHEREGWRALAYGSWRECAMTEFGYGQSRVYQLMEAARVERNISTIVEKPVKIIESQARPLAPLEPAAQGAVWARAVETAPDGKVTAKHVEQTVTEWKYNQGVRYGEQASTPAPAQPEPAGDDSIKTVTLRVARVVYLLTLGRHMDLHEIAEKTGLTENGAWRMMNRLENGHYVPVTIDEEGKWCILDAEAADMGA